MAQKHWKLWEFIQDVKYYPEEKWWYDFSIR